MSFNPDRISAFCFFIGYPRSGHSLVGAMLDAHPDVVISHEADVLKHIGKGSSRDEIFSRIYRNARRFGAEGREWSGYDYNVEGQHQGKTDRPLVIGDKQGGRSTKRLRKQRSLLPMLRREVALPLRVIHISRNPYDNIATMYRRRRSPESTLQEVSAKYFWRCRTNAKLRRRLKPEELFEARHEEIVVNPTDFLVRLARFLDVEAHEDWVNSCGAIVFANPRQTRLEVKWPRALVRKVERHIARHDFLGKSYANSLPPEAILR